MKQAVRTGVVGGGGSEDGVGISQTLRKKACSLACRLTFMGMQLATALLASPG